MWQYGTYFHIFSEFPYTSKLVRRFSQTAFFFLNFHCPREFWMNYETTLCDINPKQAVLRCKKHISPPKKRWLETFQDQKKDSMTGWTQFLFLRIHVDTLGVPPKPWVHVAIIYSSLWREPNLHLHENPLGFSIGRIEWKISKKHTPIDPFGFLWSC